MTLRLTPAAQVDVRNIYRWYREQGRDIARAFVSELARGLELIRRVPRAYPIVDDGMRRILLRRFPYALFYFADDEEIVVLGVFHGRRDPNVWKTRHGE